MQLISLYKLMGNFCGNCRAVRRCWKRITPTILLIKLSRVATYMRVRDVFVNFRTFLSHAILL